MSLRTLRPLALAAAALAFGACADAPITSPAASVSTVGSRPSFAVVAGGKTKVDICHLSSDTTYTLITVGAPAFDAHMAHGDRYPGQNLTVDGTDMVVQPDCTLAVVNGVPGGIS